MNGGWLIRITVWEGDGPIWLFAAAESAPEPALVAVQKATNAAPKLRVETVGRLSAQAIHKLGLEAGQTFDLTN